MPHPSNDRRSGSALQDDNKMSNEQTHTGTLVLWHIARFWGFVKSDLDQEEYFVHISNFGTDAILKPRLGVKVSFEIGDPIAIGKSPQAINAIVLSVPTNQATKAAV